MARRRRSDGSHIQRSHLWNVNAPWLPLMTVQVEDMRMSHIFFYIFVKIFMIKLLFLEFIKIHVLIQILKIIILFFEIINTNRISF